VEAGDLPGADDSQVDRHRRVRHRGLPPAATVSCWARRPNTRVIPRKRTEESRRCSRTYASW